MARHGSLWSGKARCGPVRLGAERYGLKIQRVASNGRYPMGFPSRRGPLWRGTLWPCAAGIGSVRRGLEGRGLVWVA